MNTNPNNTYINIAIDEDDITDEQIKLDNFTDEEYTTPYTDNFDDICDVGGMVEGMGTIFDDR